jgi:hypothetical protein
MNERIAELRARAQELAAEAFPGDVPFDPNPNPILWDRIHISYEKFAELIVKECIEQVWYTREDGINGNVSQVIKDRIKQRFGVEE